MRKQVEAWQKSELTDVTAKVVIYEAFVEGKLEAPKHRARTVHDLYFEPKYEEFRPRTIWSRSNAFTSAFRNWIPFLSSGRQQTSESSWTLASRSRSKLRLAARAASNPYYWHPSSRRTWGMACRLIDRGSDATTSAEGSERPYGRRNGNEVPVVDWIADAGSGYDTAK